MKDQNNRTVSRREFVGTAGAIAALTIVPKNVLGMKFGAVAPSDKIRMAHIGCGIQGFSELPLQLQDRLLLQPDHIQLELHHLILING